ERYRVTLEKRANGVCAPASALDEPGDVRGGRDEDPERRRRNRQAVGPGFKKLPVRVGELGRPQQIASAARDAEQPGVMEGGAKPGSHLSRKPGIEDAS